MFPMRARPFVNQIGLEKHTTIVDEEEEDNKDTIPST
jgi:hypothetical protein